MHSLCNMLSRVSNCSLGPRPGPASSPAANVARRGVRVSAMEKYMVDKLSDASSTFKEMQMRMADPDVAADATEFQRVAKAAADLEPTSTAFAQHQELEQQIKDARVYLKVRTRWHA
jgi:hypothetical protein